MKRRLATTLPTIKKVNDTNKALRLLAMTSMRSELGKIDLNNIFQSRKELNLRIRKTLEETTLTWGITCDRYEILKIEPPSEVRRSMQLQAEAERIKRKDIILSEAKKLSNINIAEGRKQSEILKAEAAAEAVEIKAIKEKDGLQLIAKNVMNGKNRGVRALDYILKRKYYDEYANILKNANVTVLPDDESGNGNSDVLGAVAMMMNNQNGHLNREYKQSNSTRQDSPSQEYDTKKIEEVAKLRRGQTDQLKTAKPSLKQDANIDWNSIAFFNNTNLDSKGK